jgi:hypothetical protein
MVKDILQKILGVPYFWGGSSAKNEEFSKSADDAAAMQCNAVLPVCVVWFRFFQGLQKFPPSHSSVSLHPRSYLVT